MEGTARSLQVEKILTSPIDEVWQAWTNPDEIAKWWGPNGFTSTIHKMDLQTGGEWKLTLHGPDGVNYPNRSIFKEIIPFQKIVFEHFNPSFITTVNFEAQGEQTVVNWTMLFETIEMRDIVVKAHQADVGLKQNLERLANHLAL